MSKRTVGLNPINNKTEPLTIMNRSRNSPISLKNLPRTSAEFFLQAFRTSPIAILINRREDGRFIDVNDAFVEWAGMPREKMLGKTGYELGFVTPEERKVTFTEFVKMGEVRNARIRRRRADGEMRDLLLNAVPIILDGETVIMSMYIDVTEQIRLQENLTRSEALFSKVFKNNPLPIAVSNLSDGKIRDVNAAFMHLFGFTDDVLIGKTALELGIISDTEARDKPAAHLKEKGVIKDLRTSFVRADGQVRDTLLNAVTFESGGENIIITMFLDITEQNRLEKELREADRMKNEFIATLGHELRNPLAPIVSAVEILKRMQLNADAKELVGIIEHQSKQMSVLLKDLLDVTRIIRGKIVLSPAPSDVRIILKHAIETVRPHLMTEEHDLLVNAPVGALFLEADPVRLEQILVNILDNAAKYTPKKGKISVTVECSTHYVQIRVRDSGVGIPHTMLEKVFEPFTQVDREPHRQKGGLGIGLMLSRNLARLHGGELRARSDGPGKGSEFILELPLGAQAESKHSLDSVEKSGNNIERNRKSVKKERQRH